MSLRYLVTEYGKKWRVMDTVRLQQSGKFHGTKKSADAAARRLNKKVEA